MANISYIETSKSKLDSINILSGQRIICTDTGEEYYDSLDGDRIFIGKSIKDKVNEVTSQLNENMNNININSDSIEQINLTLQNYTPVKLADGAYIGGNTINLNDSLNNYKRFMIIVGDGNGNPNIWKTYNFTNYSYPGNFIIASDMVVGAENLVLTVKSGGNAIEVTTMASSYIRKVFGFKY